MIKTKDAIEKKYQNPQTNTNPEQKAKQMQVKVHYIGLVKSTQTGAKTNSTSQMAPHFLVCSTKSPKPMAANFQRKSMIQPKKR